MDWRKIGLIVCQSALLLFSSCAQEALIDETVNVVEIPDHRISMAEAKQNAVDFLNTLSGQTRSSGCEVSDVVPFCLDTQFPVTRSSNDYLSDTLLYFVNLSGDNGYVIVGADDRLDKVVAYIDHGHYDGSEVCNNGFNGFIFRYLEPHLREPDPGDDGGGGGGSTTPSSVGPLLEVTWGQEEPYNWRCNQKKTGCVPTAISQICSFFEYPSYISWTENGTLNSANLNWNTLKAAPQIPSYYATAATDQVSKLMRFWGIMLDVDYGDDGTGVDMDDVIPGLRDWGFTATNWADFNDTNVYLSLSNGDNLIMTSAYSRYYHVGFVFRKYVDGHCWVIDGYRRVGSNKYFHCNWGLDGNQNGYYLSTGFDSDECYEHDANTDQDKDFSLKYKVKYSVVSR